MRRFDLLAEFSSVYMPARRPRPRPAPSRRRPARWLRALPMIAVGMLLVAVL